jgi:putative transposase
METGKRRRMGERGWREVLRRFDAEGATVAEFCRREGVSQSSLQRWRARLASAPGGAAGDERKKSGEPQQAAADGFVDLGALGASEVSAQPRLELKLDLGGGLTLQLMRG